MAICRRPGGAIGETALKHQLAIQHVRLHWDKAGRGAEPGAIRNALPRELPFRAPFETDKGWYHEIRFDARDGYRRDEAMHELGKVEEWRVPVKTRLEDDHLWVKFMVANRAPCRPNINGWIARIPFGKRLIFRTNNKSDGDHQRWYFEDNFQIGFAATATLDLPLFREIDERALLY